MPAPASGRFFLQHPIRWPGIGCHLQIDSWPSPSDSVTTVSSSVAVVLSRTYELRVFPEESCKFHIST